MADRARIIAAAALVPLLVLWSALCLCPHGAQASTVLDGAEHAAHCAPEAGGEPGAPDSPSDDSPCPHCGMSSAALAGPESTRAHLAFEIPSVPVPMAWDRDLQAESRSTPILAHAKRVLAPPSTRSRTCVLLI